MLFHWRWYYHVPTLPLWALIVLLLVGPKANRHRRAWLILIPLGLVLIVWDMPLRLLSMPSETMETLGFFFVSTAMAWSAVWLLGHWLAIRNRTITFFLIFGAMLAMGAASYAGRFERVDHVATMLIPFGLYVGVAALAMTLTGYICRDNCSMPRFLGWLLAWIFIITMTPMLLYSLVMIMFLPGLEFLGMIAMMIGVSTLFVGGTLYLITLPFVILAFKSPFYRERFEKLFRVKVGRRLDWAQPEILDDAPLSTEPTGKPVMVDDVIGRWQFYLDRASVTVSVDFRPDGTFSEMILANQGGVRECPGGTWTLEGALVHLTGYVTAVEGASESRTWWMVDTSSGLALFGGDDADPETFFRMRLQQHPFAPTDEFKR